MKRERKKQDRDRLMELLLLSRNPESFSENQRQELNQLLRESEVNQDRACQFLLDGEGLTELLKTSDIADISAGRTRNHARQPQRFTWPRLPRVPRLATATMMTMVVLLFCVSLGGFLLFAERGPVAEVEDRFDTHFAREVPADGHLSTRRPYRLLEGMATLRFRNGVLATLNAPAEFEIFDAFNLKLAGGMIRAVVPESGQGFTVHTPAAMIEDLGTEFAVEVDAGSGESEIHVFDGLVHVNSRQGGKLLKALEGGEGIRVNKQEQQRLATEAPDRFPAPRDVSFQRWKQASAKLRKDPDLLCYYTFESKATQLIDVAMEGHAIDGIITGAEWVSGRWPGKKALLFDDVGDRVSINIPGTLDAMGISAWVYVTEFHTGIAPVLNSDGWERGDVHLQLDRSKESLFVGIGEGFANNRYAAKVAGTGRWMHLAASIDTATRECMAWVDGELATRQTLKPETLLSPGSCFIGDWLDTRPKEYRAGRRSFKGRIDELAIWNRGLTKREVKRLFRAGRPNAR